MTTANAESLKPSFFRDLRDAVRGIPHDYTEGPIDRAIILLAVPMMLEMVMESLFAVVDIFWVSRLGANAIAAVGLTESLLTVVYALAMGLSIGVTALVARRIGEKRPDEAARAAVQGIMLGMLVAAVLGTIGALNAPRLLELMGASPEVVAIGSGYTRVMLGGEATVILLFLINAAFRGAGDATIAMRVLWTANAFNILLGPCFIFGLGPFPELGVTGAAVATTIGRGIGVLVQIRALVRGRGALRVKREHLKLELPMMRQLIKLSAPGTLQTCIGMLSWILLIRLLATFGSAALAGYTIAIRLVIFALLPSWGLSNAAATLVGQGLGAKKPDRAETAVWRAAAYNGVFLIGVGALFVGGAGFIVPAFTSDPEVVRYGTACLRIVSLGFPLYAYGMVLTQAFNGAGDTWTPTWLNFGIFWLFEIPLAWFLANTLGVGPSGTFWAIAIAFSTLALASAAIFKQGKWKTRVV